MTGASLRHAGIVVADLDRSLAFYEALLGLRAVRRMNEEGPFLDAILGMNGARVTTVKLAFDGDAAQVELLAFAEPHPELALPPHLARRGPTHLAFTVQGLDALYAKMSEAGVHFTTTPRLSVDGRAKVTFCRDPDGTYLELVELQS